MTLIETVDYSLAITYTPVAPALDLEEFFAKGDWKSKNDFSEHQQLILNQGRRFLALAIEGRAIGLSAVNEGKLGVDLPAIRAYLLSYKAYNQSRELRNLALDQVLMITDSVLNRLISRTGSTEKILAQNDIDIARRFFLSLSTVPIKSDE